MLRQFVINIKNFGILLEKKYFEILLLEMVFIRNVVFGSDTLCKAIICSGVFSETLAKKQGFPAFPVTQEHLTWRLLQRVYFYMHSVVWFELVPLLPETRVSTTDLRAFKEPVTLSPTLRFVVKSLPYAQWELFPKFVHQRILLTISLSRLNNNWNFNISSGIEKTTKDKTEICKI